MREILFRGKDKDDHKWYTGAYFPYTITTFCYAEDYAAHPNNTKHYIVFDRMTDWGLPNQHLRAEVIPETVGQYTGLKDKNGKQIFEGDIVHVWWGGNVDDNGDPIKYKAIIEFGNPNCEFDWGWQLAMLDYFPFNKSILLWVDMEESDAYCEVIGNIHDNPELLEVEG